MFLIEAEKKLKPAKLLEFCQAQTLDPFAAFPFLFSFLEFLPSFITTIPIQYELHDCRYMWTTKERSKSTFDNKQYCALSTAASVY